MLCRKKHCFTFLAENKKLTIFLQNNELLKILH